MRIGGFCASIIVFLVLYFYSSRGFSWKKKQKVIEPVKPQINKEREFQYELSELQREYDKCDSMLTVIGILIGFVVAIGVLMWTLMYTISQTMETYLFGIALIPIIPAIGLVFELKNQYKNKIPEKTLLIKNKFIAESDSANSELEVRKLETLKQILSEQQKTNDCLLRLEEELKTKSKKQSKAFREER